MLIFPFMISFEWPALLQRILVGIWVIIPSCAYIYATIRRIKLTKMLLSVPIGEEKVELVHLQTLEELDFIYELKTAALIEASMMIGAILAGADEAQVKDIEKVGYNIGIAFQVQDDILDVTGTFEELGKPIGSDEKNDKVTCVSLMGLEKAKEEVERLSKEAVALLNLQPYEHTFLEELILNLIHRNN